MTKTTSPLAGDWLSPPRLQRLRSGLAKTSSCGMPLPKRIAPWQACIHGVMDPSSGNERPAIKGLWGQLRPSRPLAQPPLRCHICISELLAGGRNCNGAFRTTYRCGVTGMISFPLLSTEREHTRTRMAKNKGPLLQSISNKLSTANECSQARRVCPTTTSCTCCVSASPPPIMPVSYSGTRAYVRRARTRNLPSASATHSPKHCFFSLVSPSS